MTPKRLILLALALAANAPAFATDAPAAADAASSTHAQATLIPQYHGSFPAPYSGPNSLDPGNEGRTSLTATLFQGYRLWRYGEAYVNPELSAGSGLSGTHGMAAYPNGEIYRVDDPNPKLNLSRLYLRQSFALGQGPTERIEDDVNQLAATLPVSRLSVTLGKFSLNDFFDANAYSHDPRTQFFNWAFMDNLAWDYAADTRGYTWALMLELNQEHWAVRAAIGQVPLTANGLEFDEHLAQAHGDNIEGEARYAVAGHPGKVRLLAWSNHANMGDYRAAVALSPAAPDVTLTRSYSVKYGLGLNAEQELGREVGAFLRLGWNDGKTETWNFTEADQSASAGVSLKGSLWGREPDVAGLALAVDGLSPEHRDYLAAGGSGFILGDGALNYALEQVVEAYYSWQALRELSLSVDAQFARNPGYNQDRGPVFIAGLRLHYEL